MDYSKIKSAKWGFTLFGTCLNLKMDPFSHRDQLPQLIRSLLMSIKNFCKKHLEFRITKIWWTITLEHWQNGDLFTLHLISTWKWACLIIGTNWLHYKGLTHVHEFFFVKKSEFWITRNPWTIEHKNWQNGGLPPLELVEIENGYVCCQNSWIHC